MDLSSDALDEFVRIRALQCAPCGSLLHERILGFPGVVCGTSSSGGRGLFAARNFRIGDTIAEEDSSLWQKGDENGSVHTSHSTMHETDAVMLQMAPFCLSQGALDGVTLPMGLTRRQLMLAAMQANCFELEARTSSGDAALFPIICLANHSCMPNAVVEQIQPNTPSDPWLNVAPRYRLSARCPVTSGQELRISYTPRTWPQAKRKAACKELWKFECGCERCAAPYDDTIGIRLACCNGGWAYFPNDITSAICLLCGTTSDLTGLKAATADRDEVLSDVAFAGDADCSSLSAVADGLLHHPVLAVDDARLFAVITGLAGHVSGRMQEPELESNEAASLQELFEQLMSAVATAALRSRFVTLQDLGLEVDAECG